MAPPCPPGNWAPKRLSPGTETSRNETGERLGSRQLTTPQGRTLMAAPPEGMGERQAADPNRSYPFKKLYRGLLEEYQPARSGGAYDALKKSGQTGQLRPIGVSKAGDDVYEPAYPIQDPQRTFERYDATSPIGLQYVTTSQGTSPQARFQRVISDFEERVDLAEQLSAAIQTGDILGEDVGGLESAGKVAFAIAGPGRQMGKILLSIEQTTDAFNEVARDVSSSLEMGSVDPLMTELLEHQGVHLTDDGLSLKTSTATVELTEAATASGARRKELALLRGDLAKAAIGQSFMRPAQAFGNGGVMNFQVPDREYEDVYVPFGDRFETLQRGALAAAANAIEEMGNADRWEHDSKSEDVLWSVWFDRFLSREIERFAGGKENVEQEGTRVVGQGTPLTTESINQTIEFTQYDFTEELPGGFGSYLLTHRFYNRMIEATAHWEKGVVPDTAWQARRDLIQLHEGLTRLSKKTLEAVKGGRDSIERYFADQAEETYGFLALQNATVENVRLRFSSRFGDREWEGYLHPVSQHVGGANAEVTLELTTNNQLLLDQLGELKRSQEALAEMRKTQDVVPPLIEVKNRGNILRAHGIRRCAYRSHTINMAEDKPGYYKVRLELVQDEKTLQRTETFRRVGGTQNGRILSTRATAPLTVPFVGDPDGSPREKVAFSRPAAVYDLYRKVFPELPGRTPTGADAQSDTVFDNRTYQAPTDPGFAEIIGERSIIEADVRYHLPGDRPDGNAFTADFVWRDGEDRRHITKDVGIDELLSPLTGLLEKARKELEEGTFVRLVQRVEGALSTTGYRKGLLLGWLSVARARLLEAFAGESRQRRRVAATIIGSGGTGGGADPTRGGAIAETPIDTSLKDNVTKVLSESGGEIQVDAGRASFVPYVIKSYRLAAAELTNALFGTSEVYSLYRRWLSDAASFPGLDRQETVAHAERAHQALVEQQNSLPSAYTDLLMPALRDPQQDGTNILAPDFPFGPGTAELTEDVHFDRYEVAHTMRQVANVKMATIGFGVVAEYTTEGRHEEHNLQTLRQCFNAAVEDLRAEAGEKLKNAPFNLSDGEDDYFRKMKDQLEANKAFAASIDNRIRTEDLVQALRISKSAEYVTHVMEAAAADAGTQVKVENSEKLSPELPALVENVFEKLRKGEGLSFSAVSNADLARTVQNSTDVQGDPWLLKEREELIRLYQADDEVIQDYLGYHDRFSGPRRAKLRRRLKESWKGWEGMRRAFPSYMLMLSGHLGTGIVDTLSDIYSWTAVQQIEIRDVADAAGEQCSLILSNMRKRISGGRERPTDTFGAPKFDQTMELKVGNHMQVYAGYGPDVAHMEPFAGRVTSVQHGATTQVGLSSYSTTMNNPPNEGRGFFVDGWDGQQSLAEAILYTISQTSGLEGLGRRAPGSAADQLGRSARGFADEDYRANVMISLYRTFGAPGLKWLIQDEEARQRAGTLLDIVTRYDVGQVKDWILGDPQIYENVWVTGSPESSGPTDMIFGGLADWLTGGKGWGWAALPGETAWAQLKDQSKLFPDYVVTSRPYNDDVPLEEQGEHPLRETLYFGPKTGGCLLHLPLAPSLPIRSHPERI